MSSDRFSVGHIPKYSLIFLTALKQPLVIYITLAGNLLTTFGAYVFYHLESGMNPNVQHFFDAYWWAMSTVTTVGFGDIVPMTTEGRLVAMFLMVTGILCFFAFTTVMVTVITGLATTEIESSEKIVGLELEQLYERLNRIEKLLMDKSKT